MINKKLEKDIKEVKDFVDLWVGFKEQFHSAFNKKEILPEEEKKFLEIKSLIARKYEIMTRLFETSDEKAMDIISQVVSLDTASKMSEMQFKKIENDWHFLFINFNKLLGSLESTREQLAKVSRVREVLKKLFLNPFMILVIIAAVVIIIFIFLQKTGIVEKIKQKMNPQTEESAPQEDLSDS